MRNRNDRTLISSLSTCWILNAVSMSILAVTSSRITTAFRLSIALARPTSWLWPWEKPRSPTPTVVSSVQLWRPAIFWRTEEHIESLYSESGSRFWRIVPGKRTGSRAKNVTRLRSACLSTVEISISLMMRPDSGRIATRRASARVQCS